MSATNLRHEVCVWVLMGKCVVGELGSSRLDSVCKFALSRFFFKL